MDQQAPSSEGVIPGRLSASRRERELRRYGEAVLALRNSKGSIAATSSVDVPLTAFAQLVALRLKAKRALISLFDRNSQYILAEATQTLSLQQDYVHDDGDALHWGSAILSRTDDFSGELLQLARKSKTEDGMCGKRAALIIPDLEGHPRFSNHRHVVNAPFARCFAGVPLFTSSGFAIGTLSILDDKSRPQGLSEAEIAFLRDVSTTIMTHLEMARVQTTHQRGMRMVQGLSRFMEGKSSVDEDRAPSDEDPAALARFHQNESESLGASSRTQALNHATNQERMSDARERFFEQSQAYTHNAAVHPPLPSVIPPTARSSSLATVTKLRRRKLVTRHSIQPRGRPETPSQLQEDIVSQDVEQAFQRAAMIIQESMDMAGVLFLDASIGEFGSMRTDSGGTSSDGSDYDSVTAMDSEGTVNAANSHPLRLKPCRYLATAYQEGDDDDVEPNHRTVPEKFLRGLMKRYPHGKIYNFGDDGVLSSDEQSDTTPPSTEHRKRAWSDSVKILSIFPGVRSLAVMPLWDATRGRFFAATVAWSYNRTRLFTFQDDMNYLACCCDVVMAEVGRLDIQADVHAKTSFISSVSHELRSPLQGILGGVECLQEELQNNDPSSRQQMVQMIDTCGRGLLDIINNLLEHAHSSSSGKSHRPGAHRRRGPAADPSIQTVHDLAVLAEEVLDSALWSTPRPSASKDHPAAPLTEGPSLRVILDVDIRNLPPTGWNFHVNSGAFRRILQNLTMNAIKYTDAGGYFKVTLSMDKGAVPSMVKICCTDSGRGMSEEFLKYGLWQAFKQEDSHTPGTGLGLSLVRNLVHEMGGTISLKSVKDVGTTIKLCLPLTAGTPADVHNLSGVAESAKIKGLTFSLVGFETSSQIARLAEATRIQHSSIEKICRYLGLKSLDEHAKHGKSADILIVTEREARRLAEDEKSQVQASRAKACLIFCDSVTASRAAGPLCIPSLGQAVAVAQPLGPKQLLKTLVFCLDKRNGVVCQADKATTPAIRLQANGDHAVICPEDLVKEFAPLSGAIKVSASIEVITRPLTPKSDSVKNSSVLLVDDNPINLTLLKRCIKRLGRIDLGAMNGQEALQVYKESHSQRLHHVKTSKGKPTRTAPVRVILTDITMPVMDGLEFTRRVRAHERALDLKPAMIVALTALASPTARQEAYSSGIDLFLTKPVRFKDIEGIFAGWEAEQIENVDIERAYDSTIE